jgi:hypothetical protein
MPRESPDSTPYNHQPCFYCGNIAGAAGLEEIATSVIVCGACQRRNQFRDKIARVLLWVAFLLFPFWFKWRSKCDALLLNWFHDHVSHVLRPIGEDVLSAVWIFFQPILLFKLVLKIRGPKPDEPYGVLIGYRERRRDWRYPNAYCYRQRRVCILDGLLADLENVLKTETAAYQTPTVK